MSKRIAKCFLLALAAFSPTLLFMGCAPKDPADSSIPWNRPADWQDRPPGMGFY